MKKKLTDILKAVGITTLSIAFGVLVSLAIKWLTQASGLPSVAGLGIALFLLLTFVNYLLIKDYKK